MAYYADTAALVKLVVAEAETDALRNWMLGEGLDFVASDLARTELTRAVRGVVPDRMLRAHQVLDSLTLLAMTSQVYAAAGRLDPAELRLVDWVVLDAESSPHRCLNVDASVHAIGTLASVRA